MGGFRDEVSRRNYPLNLPHHASLVQRTRSDAVFADVDSSVLGIIIDRGCSSDAAGVGYVCT
jgi:hypothetical protein